MRNAERFSLTGQVAFVLGSSGIGRQIALGLHMMPMRFSHGAGLFRRRRASSAFALWMPQLVKSFGLAAVLMLLWCRNSDRTGERVWHNALPLGWMVLAMLAPSPQSAVFGR